VSGAEVNRVVVRQGLDGVPPRGGLFVQSTQYLQLCPDSNAHFYQSSTGGSEFGGIGIADPGQLEYTGSANWTV